MERRDRFFRGFINVYGKKALNRFKDVPADKLLDEETASERGDYAGVLYDDILALDFDDEKNAEKMLSIVRGERLNCMCYKTTRGYHFLFRAPEADMQSRTGTAIACALKCDIKSGARNSYIVRKRDGHVRETVLSCDEPDELPVYLRPVPNTMVPDAMSLEDGDGRNNLIFSSILRYQKCGFTQDEIKEILQVVNKYIFDKPLTDREMETATRNEAFEKPTFFHKNTFLFNTFAQYVLRNKHIINVNGQLNVFDGKAYVPNKRMLEKEMIDIIPKLSRTQREEAISYMEILTAGKDTSADPRYVCFNNGIYDIDTRQMLPFSPDIPVTNPIPHNYVDNAYSEIADQTLDRLADGDDDIRLLLEETIGYVFFRRQELRKSFLMVGGKRGGKSTFLDIILSIVGRENSCSLDIAELSDRFKTAELANKLVCVGDDINDDFISDTSVFKKVVSGDRLSAEKKGKDPFEFSPYCKLFFSANVLPRMKDRTGAVLDRMIIIPFTHEFGLDKAEYDPFIKYKLREEEAIEYFIRVGIEGLHRVLSRYAFTASEKVAEALEQYEKETNSVVAWCKDTEPMVENQEAGKLYTKYRMYCVEEGLQPLSGVEFGKQIKRIYLVETKVGNIGGKSVRIYRKIKA